MTELKMQTKVIHEVDVFNLEQFITHRYGITYEIVAAEEAGNGDNLHFTVDGKIEDYEMSDMRKIISGTWIPFRTGLLLNLMCFNEEIPAGEYYIKVSW